MKNHTTEDRTQHARFSFRFGGRFLCRSPPAGCSRRTGVVWVRGLIKHLLPLVFCLLVAFMILTDPLAAAFLSAGSRLRRQRPEKAPAAMAAAALERKSP